MTEDTRGTVLAVDDNDILRYSIARILLDAGFNVIEARTGREALQLAGDGPDLITLDINLPDLDGFAVCQKLKSDPATRHIPILHVSNTFVDPEYRVKGLQGGADAYMAQPFDRAEFVATVNALMRAKRTEKEALRQAERADSARERVHRQNVALATEVKQRSVEIERQSEEIRTLNSHLMKLQDEERRKIARELHDSTGQLLVLLNMNLAKLEDPKLGLPTEAAKLVAGSTEISAELTSHLRTVAYLLHPPLLDEIGLRSALDWYVQGFTERSQIAVKLTISKDFGRLSPDAEIALFRIVQECLTNVHKHSGSKTASVDLSRDATEVLLEVRDAGTKFSEDKPHLIPGTGLLGMNERVRHMDGKLIATAGPSGTLIRVTIPAAHTHSEPTAGAG